MPHNDRSRAVLAALAALVVSASSACGSSDPSGPSTGSVAGVYTLVSVNGQRLPAFVGQSSAGAVEILDDRYSLNADFTFSEIGHVRVTNGGTTVTQTASGIGAYTVTGTAILFTASDGSQWTGTSAGNALTVAETVSGIALSFAYQR